MKKPWVISIVTGGTAMLAALVVSSAPAQAACPNQAIRGELHSEQLPDCRAYELVTPTAKYGWPSIVMSADGSHAIIESLGAFQGGNQPVLNVYDVERTPGGWIASPFVQPSGLVDHRAEVFGELSANLAEGLFEYQSSSPLAPAEENLYVEDLPAGEAVEVGPLFSREAFVDNRKVSNISTSTPSASSSLTTVVFAIEGPLGDLDYLWPGDTTVEKKSRGLESLYEYKGIGHSAPALVGVDNTGQLISQCGTSLGSPWEGGFEALRAEEAYNAISADGSRVFFTASGATEGPLGDACTVEGAGHGPPADELFARTDEAETTAISEPSKEDCSTCNTSEPANAIFQGASEDGSKVFFLSDQKLLPGADGVSLYEYDFDAAREGKGLVLVSPEVMGVARVAENGSRVYFVSGRAPLTQENEYGAAPEGGEPNLYGYDTEDAQIAFIGTLAPGDVQDWSQYDVRPVNASPDGRFLLFESSADLTPDDTSTTMQVFEYDAQERTLVRVSTGQNGFNEDGNSDEYGASIIGPHYAERQDSSPRLSSLAQDGSAVFESSAALTPRALLGYPNVYEYHAGQVSLISDERERSFNFEGAPNVRLLGMDQSGTDIFFETVDQLVPQDGDTQVDVYDARIDGGFAMPQPTVCEGEGCQGALAQTPAFGLPVSAGQAAGENASEVPFVSSVAKTKAKTKAKAKAKGKRRRSGRKVRRRVVALRARGSRHVAKRASGSGRS